MENENLVMNIEQDLTEIATLIWGYMDKKYISQMKHKLDGYRQECEHNLCKEGQLLRAIIPFMPQEAKALQLLVDLLIYNDMIDKSMQDNRQLESLYRDENKDRENIKKLLYKLILFKLVVAIEKDGVSKV